MGYRRCTAADAAAATLRLGHRAQWTYSPDRAEGGGQRHLSQCPLDCLPAAGGRRGGGARAAQSPTRTAGLHARHYQRIRGETPALARTHRPHPRLKELPVQARHLLPFLAACLLLSVLPAATGTAQEGTTIIVAKSFMFAPAALTVKAGSTVTWTNHDQEPHTVA